MTTAHDYSSGIDPEHALKYAIQHHSGDRTEIVEGVISTVTPSWAHERAAKLIRRQIEARVDELDCVEGSGNLDLPKSPNWYVPDIAVVPDELADGGGALLPDQTLLIVEVTSESNADTDRVVKRKRYAEYGAPSTCWSTAWTRPSPCSPGPGGSATPRSTGHTPSGLRSGFRSPSGSTSTPADSRA